MGASISRNHSRAAWRPLRGRPHDRGRNNKKSANQEIHSDQHVRRCNLHSTNIRAALNGYPVLLHCWLDSTVALYCINGQGARVSSICIQQGAQDPRTPCRTCSGITCQQPTAPDLGSHRGSVKDHQLWSQGPTCLSKWPLRNQGDAQYSASWRLPPATSS